MKNRNRLFLIIALTYLVLVLLGVFFAYYFNFNFLPILIVLLISGGVSIYAVSSATKYNKSIDSLVGEVINTGKDNYLDAGKIGIVVFDNKYQIQSMSEMFKEYDIYGQGLNLFTWMPELQDLVNEEVSEKIIGVKNYYFSVTKQNNTNALYFRDITQEYNLKKELQESSYVVGFAAFDNINDDSDNDEYTTAISNIKAAVFNYFKNFNINYKILKNQDIYLVLNEKQLNQLIDDHFSILKTVKTTSNKENVYVTLSLSFAYGSRDYNELDDIASDLLDTAKNRGGDQAVVKKVNENEKYFGGYSEARSEKSKTRLRVIYNTIKNILNNHSNVFIVCHNDADSDCVGSALGMAKLCAINKKEVYIVLKNVSIEPMIQDVIKLYSNEINNDYKIISPYESNSFMNDNSLILMVDHNDKNQSSGIELLNRDKDVMVIDHHRRKNDLNVKSVFNYIESGASSCVEIVSELFNYAPNSFEVKKYEANIMYLGMLIDTNNFKNRVGIRTFEAAASLKEYGADPVECQNFINEPLDVVMDRSYIIESAKAYKKNIIIACMNNDRAYSRTVASQACDQMLAIRGIDASFVLVENDGRDVVVSARSNGKINVQLILEKMNGGGHLTAAGLQRSGVNINDVYSELTQSIDEYLIKEA